MVVYRVAYTLTTHFKPDWYLEPDFTRIRRLRRLIVVVCLKAQLGYKDPEPPTRVQGF